MERLIGSIRRECLDHFVVFGERSLRRTLTAYCAYYHHWRTHLSLGKDAPQSRRIEAAAAGEVVEMPEVGDLHHALRTPSRLTRSRSQRPVTCDQALSAPGISTAPDVELFEHPAVYQSADEKAYRSFTPRTAQLLNYLEGHLQHLECFIEMKKSYATITLARR